MLGNIFFSKRRTRVNVAYLLYDCIYQCWLIIVLFQSEVKNGQSNCEEKLRASFAVILTLLLSQSLNQAL